MWSGTLWWRWPNSSPYRNRDHRDRVGTSRSRSDGDWWGSVDDGDRYRNDFAWCVHHGHAGFNWWNNLWRGHGTIHKKSARWIIQLQISQLGLPSGAVHDRLGDNWLGHSARAVGDHQCGGLDNGKISPGDQQKKNTCGKISRTRCWREQTTSNAVFMAISHWTAYLGHGVGFGSMHHLGGLWAVGGIGSHHLGGVCDIAPSIGTGHEGSGSSNDGWSTHYDGRYRLLFSSSLFLNGLMQWLRGRLDGCGVRKVVRLAWINERGCLIKRGEGPVGVCLGSVLKVGRDKTSPVDFAGFCLLMGGPDWSISRVSPVPLNFHAAPSDNGPKPEQG